mgnify:CR=1 FL=1|tara:strand:- start:2008 stop:2175 length:168 start_codon:yes stop_codon:yes gene_type:complete
MTQQLEKELKDLSAKLFKGSLFAIFTPEEENTKDFKRYNFLLERKMTEKRSIKVY